MKQLPDYKALTARPTQRNFDFVDTSKPSTLTFATINHSQMAIYEALVTDGKKRPCPPPSPCCEEPCDEPSFWELLPQCRLNWIALGLAAFAIGFGLIGLGYINIGTTIDVANAAGHSIPLG